jgi:hypothetical protein
MVEYMVLVGGGMPHPSTPWPLFLAVVERRAKYHARGFLQLFDSVGAAIGSAFGADTEDHRARLEEIAYPTKRRVDRFLPNAFAPDEEVASDA